MRGLWAFLCTAVGSLLLGFLIVMLAVPSLRNLPVQILVKDDQPTRGADAIVLRNPAQTDH